MQTLSVKMTRKILEADDIVGFELRPVDNVQIPPFPAGSHRRAITLRLAAIFAV
jgi:ferredoxin-NADP reductase